jgi:autotransporter-associated beta strand protein
VVVGYLDVNGGTVVGSNNLVSALTLVNSGQVAGLADGVDFAAGILKRTAGVATVDGANTFTGVIRAEAGTIQMTNGGSFAAASSLLLSNTASLDLNGISQEFSSVNGAGSVALGSGTLTVGGSEDSAFSGAISGTGGLVKSGGGVMTLSGTSTYNGATTVSDGELIVDGAADSSTVTVNSGAILSGSGSIGGLIVNSGGTINPGNSPGTQTVVGNAVWNAGAYYNWEIHDATGGAGTGWDLYTITGTLDLGALSLGSEFNINLWSLSQVSPDINGDAINFDPAQNYTWTIATAAGGITNYTGANQFLVNIAATNGAGGFSNLLDSGTFSVVQSGNDLNLVFTAAGGAAVPEPGTWAAAALLAGGAAFMRWRKRAKVA